MAGGLTGIYSRNDVFTVRETTSPCGMQTMSTTLVRAKDRTEAIIKQHQVVDQNSLLCPRSQMNYPLNISREIRVADMITDTT